MISIRQGLFETNSSSVHALVIPKNCSIHFPNKVTLYGGEYGWEEDEVYDTINYVYQACKDRGQEEVDKLLAYLKRHNIEVEIGHEGEWNGIDHGWEVPLEELFKNESMLDRFLFGSNSFVITGNDNMDYNDEDEKDYSVEGRANKYSKDEYDILYKYN